MNRLADTAGRFEAVHHRHLAVHQHQVVALHARTASMASAPLVTALAWYPSFSQLRQSYLPVGGIVLRHQDSRRPLR